MNMRHLSDVEIVDFVEGRLTSRRASHAEACAECSARAAETRGLLERTADATVPEPSPLFWDNLSTRVSEAVDREPFPRPGERNRFLRVPAWAWAAASACATVIAVAGFWYGVRMQDRRDAIGADLTSPIAVSLPDASPDSWNDVIDQDGAWTLVQAVAEDVGWEEANAAGISARPQSTDHVIQQLSIEERSELARLLEEELHRNGA